MKKMKRRMKRKILNQYHVLNVSYSSFYSSSSPSFYFLSSYSVYHQLQWVREM